MQRWGAGGQPPSDLAQTDAALGEGLIARFGVDRPSVRAVVASVEPTALLCPLACVSPRKDCGRALNDGFEIGSVGKTLATDAQARKRAPPESDTSSARPAANISAPSLALVESLNHCHQSFTCLWNSP